jgi:adenylate cyclase
MTGKPQFLAAQSIDDQLYELRRASAPVELEPKVFDLLVYLIEHHERVISKDELLDKLWPGQVVSETALTQCVMAARKAVGDDGARQHTIKTQHGRGYRFVAAIAAPVPSAESRVPSQQEEVSCQHAVASRQPEENQKPVLSPSTLLRINSIEEANGDKIEQAEGLRRQASGPPPSSPSSLQPTAFSLSHKPSIIVLPFINMSGDPTQEYFSDGMTEEITAALSRFSSLFVIARTSAFSYKGKQVTVQDISREMGVRYVLEGSARKADGRIRIIAQLIDATTGEHLWSERYDRPLKDIFALQDEIVQKMVTTLGLQLTMQEQGIIMHKHTDNLEAYDAVLRGRESHLRFTQEANTRAQQLFEKALALDPRYAEAYTFLGLTYRLAWVLRWSADPQTLERALALAQQALALDDALPRAHSLLGFVYVAKQQYDQAIAEGERAIALDPNNADNYAYQAEVLNFAGRPEEALRLVEQAMRLNPRSPPFYLLNLGWAYNLTGRYVEATATLKEAISRNPNFLSTHFHLAISYAQQ